MKLTLNCWKPQGETRRVYVNGLPISTKAWFENSRGRMSLVFQGDDGGLHDQTLLAVSTKLGIELGDWQTFIAAVESSPPPARGRAPGQMAASRRHDQEPTRFTAEDALDLDPNAMAEPIPDMTTLIVDDREPASMVDSLRRVRNLDVQVGQLEIGDYVVPDRLVIERKTVTDFINSIVLDDKRLFTQAERMSHQDVPAVLIVEGDIYAQDRMKLPQLAGALSYLGVIQRISVLPSLSAAHTSYLIAKLVRHAVHGLGYDLALRGKKPKGPSKAAAFVLEGIPGVSPALAKALLAHFGSISALSRATPTEMRQVKGIGPTTSESIYSVLNADRVQ